jgi:hypothetical protein
VLGQDAHGGRGRGRRAPWSLLPRTQYEGLVRDVAERPETWVHKDRLRRIALEGQSGD